MKLFYENSYRLKAGNYFRKKSSIADMQVGSKCASAYHLNYNKVSIDNPLNVNPRNWSNTLKQFVSKTRRIV